MSVGDRQREDRCLEQRPIAWFTSTSLLSSEPHQRHQQAAATTEVELRQVGAVEERVREPVDAVPLL
eukprot:746584-Hanusia_phi.AAC.1